jgi:hypothetical protein
MALHGALWVTTRRREIFHESQGLVLAVLDVRTVVVHVVRDSGGCGERKAKGVVSTLIM